MNEAIQLTQEAIKLMAIVRYKQLIFNDLQLQRKVIRNA